MRTSPFYLALILAAAGCAGSSETALERSYDSDAARNALVTALDAWKNGEARGLARRKPPIRFEDDDHAVGLRLTEYELEQPDATIGLHQDIPVILMLRDAKGTVVRREALYQVALTPAFAVLRSDR